MLGQPTMGEQLAARRRHTPDNRTDGGSLLRTVETQLLEFGIQSELP